MKPVRQIRDNDCLQACIASLLDLSLEEVPCETEQDTWIDKYRDFLEPRGLSLEQIGYTIGKAPRGYSILSIWLDKEKSHAVVAWQGIVVHDPNNEDLTFASNAARRKWIVFTSLNPVVSIG